MVRDWPNYSAKKDFLVYVYVRQPLAPALVFYLFEYFQIERVLQHCSRQKIAQTDSKIEGIP